MFSENQTGSNENPGSGSAGKKKLTIPLIAAAVVVIVAAGLFMLHNHNEKTRRYNEGITQLENGDFEQALNTFTELGNFDNSGEMAEYARLEIEYKKVDGLAASGKYEEVIEILQERSTWFGDSEIGKEAGALADEYRTLTQAISDKQKGFYQSAEEKYASLNVLADSFKGDRCLCLAHIAVEDRAWMDVLTYLYAVKSGDFERSFLSETEGGSSDKGAGDNDRTVREASKSGDYEAVIEVLEKDGRLEDEETQGLKTAAVNGFHYEAAQKKLDDGDYEEAMEAFQELGDFLDAPTRYEEAKEKYQEGIYQKAEKYLKEEKYEKAIDTFESLGDFRDAQARLAQAKAEYESYKTYKEAEKLYDNGEYYQAKKKFLSIKSYKDASKRSDECVQELPANASFRTGNGSGTNITITAPGGSRSVYLKMYNSSGTVIGTIFLRPEGSGTLYLSPGDYTIKCAYGTEWYGEKDLFGDNGSYSQLLNGSNEVFSLSRNYTYTLELLSSTQGNVPSRSIGGAGDM